jgi:ABC-2 type transport system permease protein
MASFGLFLNLKMPNLNWTNEIVPIKQSMSVMISLFGGWVITVALAGLYALLASFLSPFVYLLLACVLLLALCAVLIRWILTRGAEIFASL